MAAGSGRASSRTRPSCRPGHRSCHAPAKVRLARRIGRWPSSECQRAATATRVVGALAHWRTGLWRSLCAPRRGASGRAPRFGGSVRVSEPLASLRRSVQLSNAGSQEPALWSGVPSTTRCARFGSRLRCPSIRRDLRLAIAGVLRVGADRRWTTRGCCAAHGECVATRAGSLRQLSA
jgi:hypothetical protein